MQKLTPAFNCFRLPRKPWCGYGETGLYVRPLSAALKRPYIQYNSPHAIFWIVIDIDAPIALDSAEIPSKKMLAILNGDVPAPNFLVINPENGHAHAYYALDTPVAKGDFASRKALRYAAAIEAALIRTMGGDALYVNLVGKNPIHPEWRLLVFREAPYTLSELHDSLDLKGPSKKEMRDAIIIKGLARNCQIFEQLRRNAYRMVELYRADANESQWHDYCLSKAHAYNAAFHPPLDDNEVKHIAKSVSRWTWKHYIGLMPDDVFSRKQARKGAKGGRISARARKEKAESEGSTLSEKMKQVRAKQPISVGEPWKELGISRAAYYRRKKQGQQVTQE